MIIFYKSVYWVGTEEVVAILPCANEPRAMGWDIGHLVNGKIVRLLEFGWVDCIGDEEILYPFLKKPVFA